VNSNICSIEVAMSKGKNNVREKCYVCGRRISRNSLTVSRGDLKPMYEYILKSGERRYLCSTCFNKIIGKELIDFIIRIRGERQKD